MLFRSQHHRLWTVGEDSGLCVPALGGAPGVYSARYSLMDSEQMTPMSSIGKSPERTYIDQLNNAKLLRELNSHPDDKREAYYVSTIALSDPDGKIVIETSGECWGRILREPRGHGGFGYDPLFEVVEYHHTFAELGANVKRAISHRSRALRQFLRQLDNWMPVAKP
mgnify:FL=1